VGPVLYGSWLTVPEPQIHLPEPKSSSLWIWENVVESVNYTPAQPCLAERCANTCCHSLHGTDLSWWLGTRLLALGCRSRRLNYRLEQPCCFRAIELLVLTSQARVIRALHCTKYRETLLLDFVGRSLSGFGRWHIRTCPPGGRNLATVLSAD